MSAIPSMGHPTMAWVKENHDAADVLRSVASAIFKDFPEESMALQNEAARLVARNGGDDLEPRNSQ